LKNPYIKYFGLSALVLGLDQLVKMIVHFNMEYGIQGQIVLLGHWLKLHYTLNPGMAFGIELGGDNGKLFLTTFRIIAMIGIGFYLVNLIRKKIHPGYITCIALILGGAVGNLFDSVFYGVLLDNAPTGSPSPWLHGQVVDMIYFDLWEGFLPDWIPVFGGQYYAFWPIFNIADATIFSSVFTLLIFNNRWIPQGNDPKPAETKSGEM